MIALAVALVMCLAGAASAGADVFGPIELVSLRTVQSASGPLLEQAETASESVISSDGRFVVFTGSFAGESGIWRRDLQSGAVEQVAPGRAKLPSVSAEGRYVSFTTAERLAPEDDPNRAPDVYVRDMQKPCASSGSCGACPEQQSQAEREACPFTLVSALSGSSQGATYSYPEATSTEQVAAEEAAFGSLASARSAISADGRLVVFETGADSNLLGAETPAREIVLRNLSSRETQLVSSEYDPQTGQDTGVPVPLSAGAGAALPVPGFGGARFGGASINAEGTTVAWEGQQIARQARLLALEQTRYSSDFNEPLYRRIDQGPTSPTRRVTGGSDPEDAACEASGEQQLPLAPNLADPCQGPFTYASALPEDFLLSDSGVDSVPQLSADGGEVAFLASAREVAAGEEFPGTEADTDLYVSEIGGSSSRVTALRRITELAAEISDTERAARINDFALSPDGTQVAFDTLRTEFPLRSLTYVSPIAPQAGVKELYDVDLSDGTLTRLTHGYESETSTSQQSGGLPEEDGAASPSFTGSGNTVSFSSGADNLVYGDGNHASDAFLMQRTLFTNTAPQQYLSPPPGAVKLEPAWQLSLTAESMRDGQVKLNVLLPGPGSLGASASSAVAQPFTAQGARAKHKAQGARAKHKRRTVKKSTGARRAAARTSVQTVSQLQSHAAAGGLEQLTLTLQKRYATLAQSADGLYATVKVQFSAPGHQLLSATVQVTFKAAASKSAGKARSASRHKKKRHK